MSAINDGGPAFAQPAIYDSSRDQINQASAYGCDAGMTLRDYFAAKAMPLAMQRMTHNLTRDLGNEWAWDAGDCQSLAAHAYDIADAMLAARKTGGPA